MSPPELAAQEITGIAEKVRCRALRWVACSGLLAGDDARDRFAGDNGCFSLDGSVCIAGDNRAGLERLLIICARLPFARDQLELVTEHRGIYRRPRPRRDGRQPLSLTVLELLDDLAALMPPPWPSGSP